MSRVRGSGLPRFNNNANAPCRDCPDRHPACHGECERYKQFRHDRWEAQHQVEEALKREKDLAYRLREYQK